MTRKYYEILEINENATQEEIKKAYKKLSLKYHPDRQHGKSFEEKKQANEKMKEINKAYEVLGDEELRKRYDLGETNFSENYSSEFSKAEEEIEKLREKIRKKEEEVRLTEEIAKNHEESIKIMEEIWLLRAEFIDRDGTFVEISSAMGFSLPRVYAKDLEAEGYGKLWEPYKDWLDKVWKMPITLKRGEKEKSDELKKFKEEMFKAIKETATIKETRKKEKEKARDNAKIEEEKSRAIQVIESLLEERGLKPIDLEEDYKEVINGLDKVWKIRSARDRIKANISKLGSKKSERDDEFTPQKRVDNKEKSFENPVKPRDKDKIKPVQNSPIRGEDKADDIEVIPKKDIDVVKKFDDLTREDLIKEVKQLKLDNNYLQEVVVALKTKIKELEEEIAELKTEKENPEIKKEIQIREKKLQDSKNNLKLLENISYSSSKPTNSNDGSPARFLAGMSVLVVIIGIMILFVVRKSKKKIK